VPAGAGARFVGALAVLFPIFRLVLDLVLGRSVPCSGSAVFVDLSSTSSPDIAGGCGRRLWAAAVGGGCGRRLWAAAVVRSLLSAAGLLFVRPCWRRLSLLVLWWGAFGGDRGPDAESLMPAGLADFVANG
jgi:hypothetical protein